MNRNRKISQATSESSGPVPGLFVRQQAAVCLDRVLRGDAFCPLGRGDIKESRDRAFANRLVTQALRRHGHLNRIIEKLLRRGVPKRSGLFEAILRLGLTQLLFMPQSGAHSSVHLAVEAARADRRAGRFDKLLNGVLRQAQREEENWKNLDPVLLFPDWLAKLWGEKYGRENLEKFAMALLEGAPLDLTLREDFRHGGNGGTGAKDVSEEQGQDLPVPPGAVALMFDSVRVVRRDSPVEEMAGFAQGNWWVQDVAAAIPARLFTLKKGARVLDLCAAPGGKSAQLIKAGYQVTALDNSPARLDRLRNNLLRLDYSAQIIEADACGFVAEEKYDGILIDAPCTASGTFRRHPEVLWHRKEQDVKGRVALQRLMIDNALKSLKRGGQMIFCVCSLFEEEGEAQAEWVMHNYPELAVSRIKPSELGGLGGALTPQGWLRTHPGLELEGGIGAGMDGFFAARWVREG